MRLQVVRVADGEYEFLWSHHHILMDGWCVSILIREFFAIYHGLLQGRVVDLPKPPAYAQYIKWLGNNDQEAALAYWQKYLQDYHTVSRIPSWQTPVAEGWNPGRQSFSIGGPDRESIKELCADLGVTENTFMQTAWGILLCKYNYTRDVVFGAVVSGRPAALEAVENMIGLFVNTVPVRIQASEALSVAELLKAVQQESVKSAPFHFQQLIDVQAQNELGKDLFDHIMIFENYPIQEIIRESTEAPGSVAGLSLVSSETTWQTNYDLSVMVLPHEDLRIDLVYNQYRYDASLMKRLAGHLRQVILQMVDKRQETIGAIDCLLPDERIQLLDTFNETAAAYPDHASLTGLFEEQVRRSPQDTVLVSGDNRFSYQQLNERANQLAGYLQQQLGASVDELIAIDLHRSERPVLAMLAILKIGAVCVPLDSAAPAVRKQQIVAHAGCRLVIDELVVDEFDRVAATYSKEDPGVQRQLHDLCYIIHTSGSTGLPKGCMLEYRGVINHLYSKITTLEMKPGDALCHTSELCFVGGIWQLWAPLVTGGKLILCSRQEMMDIEQLLFLSQQHGAPTLEVIPSQLNEYLAYESRLPLGSLRNLILTGEKLTPYFVHKCYQGNDSVRIFNTYGQTESSDVTTAYEVPRNGSLQEAVLIGNTIQNMKQYIVSADGSLCPVGIAGEVWTSGHGTCRGYINQAALTAATFIDNPFAPGNRLYRTGDLGRRLPDGQLEIIGRTDNQVKVRGFRIEPGEIEAALLQLEVVREAVVLQEQKNASLVAYIVCRETPDLVKIREDLGSRLPVYLQPASFVVIDNMPLLPNGKTNKKALAAFAVTAEQRVTAYEAPQTALEHELADIWKEILQKDNVGIRDNFFHLGGHSLKAIRLAGHIQRQFNIQLSLAALFNHPTIEALAEEIDRIRWANSEVAEMDNIENVSL